MRQAGHTHYRISVGGIAMESGRQAVVNRADGALPMRQRRCSTSVARTLAWWLAGLLLALAFTSPGRAQGVQVGVQVGELGAVGIERAAGAGPRVVVAGQAADPASPLGSYAQLLDEVPGRPLAIDEARARLAAGDFQRSTAAVPNLGNRAPPRWLHLDIENPGAAPLAYRLYIAEGWTDRLDVWLMVPGGATQHWQAGDARSPSRFLRMGLGFAFDAQLPPGRSELFVRADSIDSAALALRLIPQAATGELEGAAQHWLGLVHGFLLALVAAYGLLWLALRETNLLRYVVYVGSYLYMHLAYSGLAAREVWPDAPAVARFAILIGMTLFSSAGLWFARGFLGLAEIAPKVDRVVAWLVRIALAAMGVCVLADSAAAAVGLAFAYIMLFTFVMVGLGVLGVRHGREQAPIFLAATLLSMAGALVTTLAVMGHLPFSAVTFRAVEVGVMVEAAIWALALGLRLRRQQEDRARALELASHDPLTGLYNRRGFLDQALPVFSTSARSARPLAVVMLDIDHFKRINDVHGHDAGDRTLVAVAEQLRSICRRGDIVARWGGEEFVMLLPETQGDQAHALAERLREVFAGTVVALGDGGSTNFTASFGVAGRRGAMSLEDVLRASDAALYAAKHAGRDRVVSTLDSAQHAA
ncbi:MAG TPA: diguanylate cyclase [Ramlibacter sp.]|nr:diguanylate cyclase [Ramlibacter sp.]